MQNFTIRGGHALATVSIAALLAACGGGGGGAAPITQAPRVQITSENAPDVSAQAIDAGGAGSVGSFGSVTGSQSAATKTLAAFAGRASKQALGARALATATKTFACSVGGSFTLTATVANPNAGPAAGDGLTATFNNCQEAFGTANGTLSMTFVQIDSAQTYVIADATLTTFTVSVGNVAERANGSIRLTSDERSATQTITEVSSGGFTFERLVAGQVRATRTLIDYQYRSVETNATGDSSETFSYTATGSFPRLGEVSWQANTTASVVTPGNALHPSSGAGKVTGASGRSVAITVIATGLHLDIDQTGDGVVDVTRDLTWAEVDALL